MNNKTNIYIIKEFKKYNHNQLIKKEKFLLILNREIETLKFNKKF